jgi:hypothetical protein
MRNIAALTVSTAVSLALAGAASAQGFYFGFGPPAHYEPEPYYAPRYAPPPQRYYRDDPRPYFGTGYPIRRSPCQYGWTVQDGVCKPYRGY